MLLLFFRVACAAALLLFFFLCRVFSDFFHLIVSLRGRTIIRYGIYVAEKGVRQVKYCDGKQLCVLRE